MAKTELIKILRNQSVRDMENGKKGELKQMIFKKTQAPSSWWV